MGLTICSRSIALAILAIPFSAWAALGENVSSVQVDQARMNATVRTNAAAKYTVFELQTPSGTVIREYVSPANTVFAVAWEGPSLPDLRQLLGTYFAQYVEGAKSQGGGTGPRAIQQPGLVVYAGGRMGAFMGRAYVPQSIPQGVSLEEIH